MIFIGLGASIGDAQKTFSQAQIRLEKERVKVLKKSKNLKNPPMGGIAKNEFTNAVWQLEFTETRWEKINWVLLPKKYRTYLKAYNLLKILQRCEKNLGRVRTTRWDDRSLDLDILMFHDLEITKSPRICGPTIDLFLPHPEIPNRSFVLLPWKEIVDEGFSIPKFGLLTELIKNLKA